MDERWGRERWISMANWLEAEVDASGGGALEGRSLKTQKAAWGPSKVYHRVQGHSERPGATRHLRSPGAGE